MPYSFARTLAKLPAMTPFVGPETLERRRGQGFRFRIGANESAFGVSPNAKAAMTAELGRVSWYCDPEHHDLRRGLANRLGVGAGNLVVGEGIDGLLGLIVRAFVDPGEVAVTSAGAYPTFNYHVVGHGGRLLTTPYTGAWRSDSHGLAAAAAESGAKLLYLANPDNPTGSFLPRAEVESLIEGLPAGCLLVLDEAYAEFAPAGELPVVDADDPRVIRLRTFSKAHGMAGLRIGYGAAPAGLISALDKIRSHFGVGRLSQIAALASLDDPEFAAGVVREVARGRKEYQDLAASLGIETLPSFTNFVAFDFATAAAAARACALLDERDVFVRRPGVAPLDRLVRVTVGTAAERAGFAEALAHTVSELRRENPGRD